MRKASVVLTGLIALEHLWFLALEMFLWTTPMGLETFKTTQEYANASKVLAMNQGLYNGFLAVGLLWAALSPSPKPGVSLRLFFLGCVAIAGIFGGVTVGPKLFFVQAAPALVALVLVVLSTKAPSSASPS